MLCCLATLALSSPLSLVARFDEPGIEASPNLFGVFFEEINHAGDGGLYAEMVQNRSFAASDGSGEAEAWEVQGARRVANGSRSVMEMSSGGTATNSGYWGMDFRAGAEYRLEVVASGKGSRLSARLVGPGGVTLASGETARLGAGLKASDLTLHCAGAGTGSLELKADGPVKLAMASLFPAKTWKDARNGLRMDLAELVDAVQPSFVRFPGGCFVQGGKMSNCVRWKETIGPIQDRPGHMGDVWHYWSSDGLGYLEYLEWCESMGAEPLFVVNCGMSLNGNVPMSQMGPYVQDALDAIEYATGPASSKWGAVRAKDGHPAPFKMRYVEIGNEEWTHEYYPRYKLFYEAIKKKYPSITLIATEPVPDQPVDMVDEHYYSSEAFFMSQAHRYDDYPRNGPKIYVGEYAVTQGCGHGNLRAALGEAAFMIGMERNSDVVRMCSYAPLFVNVNDRTWNPDAIVFDGKRSYGTPSYYLQRMFGTNRVDRVVPVSLAQPADAAPEPKGTVGLGTWATQAEYRNLTVTAGGETVYAGGFEKDWKTVRGDWSLTDGAYRQGSLETDQRSILELPALSKLSDYAVRVQARKTGGKEGFLILFRVRDEGDFYWWNVGGWGNTRDAIERSEGGGKAELAGSVPGHVETGKWYDLEVEVKGRTIRCLVDGQLVQTVYDPPRSTLVADAGMDTKAHEVVLKVLNDGEEPAAIAVDLRGAGRLAATGTAITLTSGSKEDENSFASPKKVAPVKRSVRGLGSAFTYTFPARSVTILRIPQRRTGR